jgi:hypothetical protein
MQEPRVMGAVVINPGFLRAQENTSA